MENERKKSAARSSAGGKRRTSPAAREAQRQRAEKEAARREAEKEARRRAQQTAQAGRGEQSRPEKRRPAEQARPEKRRPTEQARPAQTREAPPQRRESRDSRAAQTAQRHRSERRENRRLSELRKKQKREAKQRTQKTVDTEVWKRLLIMGAVVAALALSMIIFFRVRQIDVVGNHYYTADEIRAATSLADGDNLLTISRGSVAGNVMARLPYIKSVRVTRRLPDAVIVTVTEFDTTYAVLGDDGERYLMTSSGKLTEQVTEQAAKEHVQIENLTLDDPQVGEQAVPSAEQGKEAAAQRRLDTLLTVLQEIEAADLVREVASVNVLSTTSISLWYGDRFNVSLGSTEQLAYKLEYLKVIVAEQKDYVTGTIDLTLDGGNEAYVAADGEN